MASRTAASSINVNGQQIALPASGRLTDLLDSLKLDPRYVIVELNGESVFKDQVSSTFLHPGDKLEIVKPVSGG